jgi:hypothetical protein
MKPAKPPSAPLKTVPKFAARPCALAKQVMAMTNTSTTFNQVKTS